jgi:hypothetical protein
MEKASTDVEAFFYPFNFPKGKRKHSVLKTFANSAKTFMS